jgi:hypothetical protein
MIAMKSPASNVNSVSLCALKSNNAIAQNRAPRGKVAGEGYNDDDVVVVVVVGVVGVVVVEEEWGDVSLGVLSSMVTSVCLFLDFGGKFCF